jgi:hypothetical protein
LPHQNRFKGHTIAITYLSVAAMDALLALLALVHDRPAAFTTQPISREFDEAGVKRERRWLEELREREHVRSRPTRLLRPIRLRRIADGNEECRDLIIAELNSRDTPTGSNPIIGVVPRPIACAA